MGSAIIEGFFGVSLTGQGLTLQPRLGLNDGYIRVYQATTDRYAAYTYDWDQNTVKLNYGTNAAGAINIKVLRLRSEQINKVLIDGAAVEFETEMVGQDTYTVFTAPTGQHQVEITKGQPLVKVVAVTPEPTPYPAPNLNYLVPARSNAPNFITPAPAATGQANPSQPNPPSQAEISPAKRLVAHYAFTSRLAFMQFVSVALIILTCLGLLVLVAIRRLTGLA
jgi:hypothetical protein